MEQAIVNEHSDIPKTDAVNEQAERLTTPSVEPVNNVTTKKSKKMAYILIISIVAIILLAGGTLGAMVFFNKQNSSSTSNGSTTVSTTNKKNDPKSVLTADTLVTTLKTGLSGSLAGADDNKSYLDARNSKMLFYAQPYKVDGYKFYTRASVNYGLVVANSTKSSKDTDLATLRTALSKNQFIETVQSDVNNNDPTYAAYYDSDAISCTLDTTESSKYSKDTTSYYVNLSCANNEDYKIKAAELKPYYDEYAKTKDTNELSGLLMVDLAVTASKTTGYTTASVGMGSKDYFATGGFSGLFYSTPDKIIHFFKGIQDALECSEFNTVDLKKAYLGETCYDAFNESTVKL